MATAAWKSTFDLSHPNGLDDPNLLLVGVVADVAEIRQYFAGRTLTHMERSLIKLLLVRVMRLLARDFTEPPSVATGILNPNVPAETKQSESQSSASPSNGSGRVSADRKRRERAEAKVRKSERVCTNQRRNQKLEAKVRREWEKEAEKEREAAKQEFERMEAERVATMEHIDLVAERVWKFCARYPAVLTQSQLESFQSLKSDTADLVFVAKRASAAEKDAAKKAAVQKAAAAAKAAAAKADVEKTAIEQASKDAKKGDETKKIDESEGSKNA
jgi:hypothetical protein